MKRVLLVLAFFFMQPGRTFAQAPPCQAKIELTMHDQMLTVRGHCRSLVPEPARYRYRLVVVRQSRGGRSQNNQGGEFTLAPQQDAVLSEVRLNAGPQDLYQARLLIFDLNGRVLAQDSASQSFPQH
ncbi:MAG: hypothetical protein JWR44_959 [Hymenobacter sp.]|jgi:hypothetical protein|nr:hypothetical protein [Hymenobacter sp.]